MIPFVICSTIYFDRVLGDRCILQVMGHQAVSPQLEPDLVRNFFVAFV